jgi:hypothetical protein
MQPFRWFPSLVVLALVPRAVLCQGTFVVPSGTTLEYDTANGPIVATHVLIEPGATLRAKGRDPLRIHATLVMDLQGTLDASGFAAPVAVSSLNASNIPEPGAAGGPGATPGGTGSPLVTASSPSGGTAAPARWAPRRGGGGGEAGLAPQGIQADLRRPGGGGGGALAADQPLHPDPDHPLNLGLVAGRGKNGAGTALGVLSLLPPPAGGPIGARAFTDADPSNDFYGIKRLDGGPILTGELSGPVAGVGGGGGGDAINGNVWPPPVFDPTADEKGAGGGGGGGLAVLSAGVAVVVGSEGRLLVNGGAGGGGENTLFFDSIGGGSGGGSGGYLLVQAPTIDLSAASERALQALGGRGGWGKNAQFGVTNAGGNGGPGVIALHLLDARSGLDLPPGTTLAELCAPTAHVLLPVALP